MAKLHACASRIEIKDQMDMKAVVINMSAVVLYSFLYYFLLRGTSGGDILMIFLFLFSIFMHLCFIIAIRFRRPKALFQSMLGIFIGFLVCFFMFKAFENAREKTPMTMEPVNLD